MAGVVLTTGDSWVAHRARWMIRTRECLW